MRFLIFVVFLSVVLLPGCKTDFEINDDWQDITIVYGLLNASETTHYLRVQKAFLGNASAYDMAQYSDSILYQEGLNIYMRERKNGILKKTFDFNDTVKIPKDSGIFACDGHYVFKTTGALDVTAEYRIFIEKAGKPTVASSTTLLSSFIIQKPSTNEQDKISFYSSDPYTARWLTCDGGRVYSVAIDFSYWEITATDTVLKTLSWNDISSVIAPSLAFGQNLYLEIPGTSFLGYVGSMIKEDSQVISRVVKRKGVDFHFYVGNDNFNTYMQLSMPSTGIVQDKPSFTNIENGIGLFASRYSQSVYGKILTDKSIDSLADGQITHHLKFLDLSASTTYWSMTGE